MQENLTIKSNFAKVYTVCENIYGRTVTALDVNRAFARYLKVTSQEETFTNIENILPSIY